MEDSEQENFLSLSSHRRTIPNTGISCPSGVSRPGPPSARGFPSAPVDPVAAPRLLRRSSSQKTPFSSPVQAAQHSSSQKPPFFTSAFSIPAPPSVADVKKDMVKYIDATAGSPLRLPFERYKLQMSPPGILALSSEELVASAARLVSEEETTAGKTVFGGGGGGGNDALLLAGVTTSTKLNRLDNAAGSNFHPSGSEREQEGANGGQKRDETSDVLVGAAPGSTSYPSFRGVSFDYFKTRSRSSPIRATRPFGKNFGSSSPMEPTGVPIAAPPDVDRDAEKRVEQNFSFFPVERSGFGAADVSSLNISLNQQAGAGGLAGDLLERQRTTTSNPAVHQSNELPIPIPRKFELEAAAGPCKFELEESPQVLRIPVSEAIYENRRRSLVQDSDDTRPTGLARVEQVLAAARREEQVTRQYNTPAGTDHHHVVDAPRLKLNRHLLDEQGDRDRHTPAFRRVGGKIFGTTEEHSNQPDCSGVFTPAHATPARYSVSAMSEQACSAFTAPPIGAGGPPLSAALSAFSSSRGGSSAISGDAATGAASLAAAIGQSRRGASRSHSKGIPTVPMHQPAAFASTSYLRRSGLFYRTTMGTDTMGNAILFPTKTSPKASLGAGAMNPPGWRTNPNRNLAERSDHAPWSTSSGLESSTAPGGGRAVSAFYSGLGGGEDAGGGDFSFQTGGLFAPDEEDEERERVRGEIEKAETVRKNADSARQRLASALVGGS